MRPQQALRLGTAGAGEERGGARDGVDRDQSAEPAQVEAHHGAVGAAVGRHPAHHARAAPERHDGDAGVHAHREHLGDLRGVGGQDHRVGRRRGVAGAQAVQVRVALAARVLHPVEPLRRHVRGTHHLLEPGADGAVERAVGQPHRRQVDGRARRVGGGTELAPQPLPPRGGQRAGLGRVAPAPPDGAADGPRQRVCHALQCGIECHIATTAARPVVGADGTEAGVPDGTDRTDPTEERLLAAVRDEVIAYGVRRATATSIAQRAGVSRMTVYRRGGGVKQLVLDALSREFETFLAQVSSGAVAPHARGRLVAGVISAIGAARQAPLVGALRKHDPELLLPYLVDRHGRTQQAVLAYTAAMVGAGVADGSVRPVDVRTASYVLLHALQDFVISAEILAATEDLVDLDAEIAHLVDAYLAPAGEGR